MILQNRWKLNWKRWRRNGQQWMILHQCEQWRYLNKWPHSLTIKCWERNSLILVSFVIVLCFLTLNWSEKIIFNLKTNQKKAVIVDEEEIYVNKLLLLNFPYFKAMFNISMSEQQSNQVGFKKINMIHELIVFSFVVKSWF